MAEMRRDFTYIDDIVAGVVACLDHPPARRRRDKAGRQPSRPHRLYNIGNNRSEELMRMIALLEEACGRKAEMELLPMQPGDVPETYADIAAIERISASGPRRRSRPAFRASSAGSETGRPTLIPAEFAPAGSRER